MSEAVIKCEEVYKIFGANAEKMLKDSKTFQLLIIVFEWLIPPTTCYIKQIYFCHYEKKTNNLLENIKTNPYQGIGKPEPLKYALAGYWSQNN